MAFLYEGISKIIITEWSSAPYLAGSRWIFSPLFQALAENSAAISVIDFLNIFGLDRLIVRWRDEKERKPVGDMPSDGW